MKECRYCGNVNEDGWQKCIKCEKSLEDAIKIEQKNTKENEEPVVCYDCLKTRGFWIAIPLIIASTIIALLGIFGQVHIKWYLFAIFWGFCSLLVGIFILFSYMSLKEYCTKNTHTYKNTGALATFVITTILGLISCITILLTLPGNYEWVMITHQFD